VRVPRYRDSALASSRARYVKFGPRVLRPQLYEVQVWDSWSWVGSLAVLAGALRLQFSGPPTLLPVLIP